MPPEGGTTNKPDAQQDDEMMTPKGIGSVLLLAQGALPAEPILIKGKQRLDTFD
jgi:hypothetical protein